MQDVNIVFFPHAGGSASNYKCFSNKLNELGYNSFVVEYPGHGTSIQEKLIPDMKQLVNYLYDKLFKNETDVNYVFFGHSMGSWIAYEMCRKLYEEGKKTPLLLFVSGNTPPALKKSKVIHDGMTDEEFIKGVLDCGGTSPEVFEVKELRDIFLPILRNDYSLLEKYTANDSPEEFKVRSDIIAMSGKQDKIVGRDLETWETCTKKDIQTYYFTGKHFYLFDHVKKISDIISEQIMLHMVG